MKRSAKVALEILCRQNGCDIKKEPNKRPKPKNSRLYSMDVGNDSLQSKSHYNIVERMPRSGRARAAVSSPSITAGAAGSAAAYLDAISL
ncbi:hypothetical protein EVAR_51473_1 [Eumeta japonica]|uniref:Uncharacterized protein n=1 Tax=Eumeta variegata TaxID=151549 RepID=A0A4C1Z118_EUMVA|nr:hypothetical protein EVAR_51473_1 [Eumeta japonica]